jgi:DNA-binding MarR family transcriptional regulator
MLTLGPVRQTSRNAETLQKAVTELSLATAQLVRRLRTETDAEELGWTQLAIVGRLDQGGPATTADLARAEAMKPQSMGATLAMLEEEGLVERRPHPTDGRQVLFALTAAGAEARRRRGVAKQAWLHAAMARLNPAEQRTLIAASALIRRLGDA